MALPIIELPGGEKMTISHDMKAALDKGTLTLEQLQALYDGTKQTPKFEQPADETLKKLGAIAQACKRAVEIRGYLTSKFVKGGQVKFSMEDNVPIEAKLEMESEFAAMVAEMKATLEGL